MNVKTAIGQRPCIEITDVDITSNAFSIQAILKAKVNQLIPIYNHASISCTSKLKSFHLFTIDGHASHVMELQQELQVGLMSGLYQNQTDGAWNKSLVIGIGSGQSSLGVAQISQASDLVDIAPLTIERLRNLNSENGHLADRSDITVYLEDGFGFTKACQHGPYDFLLNTSTYPSTFNASKLYSDEFVVESKKCLKPTGTYETYFDHTVVNSSRSAAIFLRPILRHFETVDIFFQPYPIVFAYDGMRKTRKLSPDFALRPTDREYLIQREKKVFPLPCQQFVRLAKTKLEKWLEDVPLNTLDQAFLETVAIRRYVENFYEDLKMPIAPLTLFETWPGAQVLNTCEPFVIGVSSQAQPKESQFDPLVRTANENYEDTTKVR